MKRKFSYRIKGLDVFMMALSFALAIYDMNALREGIQVILRQGSGMSAGLAFGIATIANTFALTWGFLNGRNKAKHIFNKSSAIGFIGWFFFGVVYAIIEFAGSTSPSAAKLPLIAQISKYVILAVSYIFSGFAIQHSAREMWDADASACREAENEFSKHAKQVAKEDSEINYMLSALENYSQNYESLDEQYQKQLDAIHHAEDSVINEILGKTLQNNPSITPKIAREVVEEARRDFIGKR